MTQKPYFPLYVDLNDWDILFIGGGSIASRRTKVLLDFAEHITVIAPQAEDEILRLAEEEKITLIRRRFEATDLAGRDLVFAATDDKDLNEEIAAMCREKGIYVNAASDRDLCDFFFPGIVKQGETVIGITASGKDHVKARKIRERIQNILTEEGI